MAGELVAEYMGTIKPQIESAIDGALDYMGENLKDSLEKSALERVYSYTPAPYFMAKRRGELLNDANYVVMKQGHSLTVANVTVTQMGVGGEVNWVESGFRQHDAGARPFMEEGLAEYVSTRADSDLTYAMSLMGF